MNKSFDSRTVFKFFDDQLMVRRVKPNPAIILAHPTKLKKRGSLARYNLIRVELKTLKFSAGSKSLSIENAVVGPIPKHFLFNMVLTVLWTANCKNFSIMTSAIFRYL